MDFHIFKLFTTQIIKLSEIQCVALFIKMQLIRTKVSVGWVQSTGISLLIAKFSQSTKHPASRSTREANMCDKHPVLFSLMS